jgi:cation transport ATPase
VLWLTKSTLLPPLGHGTNVEGRLNEVTVGARGADAALEQAEIVLMHDRLENLVAVFRLSI